MRNGHNVVTADNGNQALEKLKLNRQNFDLWVTDLQMPIMDGFESVRRFREYERIHLSVQAGYSPLFIIGNNIQLDANYSLICDMY